MEEDEIIKWHERTNNDDCDYAEDKLKSLQNRCLLRNGMGIEGERQASKQASSYLIYPSDIFIMCS